MEKFFAEQTIKSMIAQGTHVKGARVGVLGLTFKENCSDLRNTRVIDIIRELESYGVAVVVCDPQADAGEAARELGIELHALDSLPPCDALVAAVAHREFAQLSAQQVGSALKPGGTLIDVKAMFDPEPLRGMGLRVWRL